MGGRMKRFVIPGLVVVHLLLHALALLTLIGPWFHSAWSDALDLPILMLGPSQGALLAVWIALGGRGTWLRVILAAAGIVAYMACFKPNDPGFAYLGAGEFMGTTICTMVFLGTSLLLARLSGLELTRPARAVPGRPRSQFFIRDILLWTTALAVVLSAARFLGSKEWHVIDFTDVGLVAALASLPLVAAACLWAALGRERLIARLALLPLAIGAGAVLLRDELEQPWWARAIYLGIMAAWLVPSLLVVRWAGYRLHWQWRFSGKAVE